MKKCIWFFVVNYVCFFNVSIVLDAQDLCDTMVSLTGKKIAVRFIEVKGNELTYVPCDQPIENKIYVPVGQVKEIIRNSAPVPVIELQKKDVDTFRVPLVYLKNNFQTNFGFIPILNEYSFSFYIESLKAAKRTKDPDFTFMKYGGGVLPRHFLENGGIKITPFVSFQIGLLKGMNFHYFEVSGGAMLIYNPYALLLPVTANIGYRYQPTDGKIVIRSGVSWPEGLYLGIGLRY